MSRPALDEATRPTAVDGQDAPAAVGDAVPPLVQVHDHFRAELAHLRDVVEQVRSGASGVGEARSAVQTMSLRANAWALGGACQAQCVALTTHHEIESAAMFPHLQRQEPRLADVLARLHEEHLVVHDLLEGVDAALVELARSPGELGRLVEAVDVLTATLVSHFAYEERELLGPLARHGMVPGQVRAFGSAPP